MAVTEATVAVLCCITDQWEKRVVGTFDFDNDVDHNQSPMLDALDESLCHWGDKSALISANGEWVTSYFDLTSAERESLKAAAKNASQSETESR